MKLEELQKYQKHIKNHHCKTCKHIGRFNDHLFYCKIRKSFYTRNLKLKIKAGDVACPLHDPDMVEELGGIEKLK